MIRLGMVMDDITSINYHKDSTLAMLWEAQDRQYEIFYFEQAHLFIKDGVPYGEARKLTVFKDEKKWVEIGEIIVLPLMDLDIILMRKDPPFNQEYIYTTYILEHAEQRGVVIANRPQALRDANEKMFTTFFPQCCPPSSGHSIKRNVACFLAGARRYCLQAIRWYGWLFYFSFKG